jgi:hypothetical protein
VLRLLTATGFLICGAGVIAADRGHDRLALALVLGGGVVAVFIPAGIGLYSAFFGADGGEEDQTFTTD